MSANSTSKTSTAVLSSAETLIFNLYLQVFIGKRGKMRTISYKNAKKISSGVSQNL